MVDPHTRTHAHRALPPELLFACWPPPVVLLSWMIFLPAFSNWNFEVAGLAALAGTSASALAPIGLGIAIRASRLAHPADERPAIWFAVIGNALVVIQLVLIIGALVFR